MEYGGPESSPGFRMPRPRENYLRSRPFGPRLKPPHLLSESLLLPSSQQPPPMFGPRGATIPPRFFNKVYNQHTENTQNDYWCETCDRGFKTQFLLEDHKKEHQKCNIDGCQFIAHPKVITKHIQMQHSSGLYNKISKLSDPHEIEKWREERRKKFPTKANIDKKKAEMEEKIERGEKMNLKQNKFPDIVNRNASNKRIHPFLNKKTASIARRKPKKNEKQCPTTLAKHSLRPFSGINDILFECEKEDVDSDTVLDIEDEDFVAEVENTVQTKNNLVCGAITQLIADYGSSDDDATVSICNETKGNTAASTSDMSKIHIEEACATSSSAGRESNAKVNNNCKPEEQKTIYVAEKKDCEENDGGPEEVKIIKVTERLNFDSSVISIGSQASKPIKNAPYPRKSRATRTSQFLKRKLPSTLLEKLLSNDIRHERNVTLQCVRYIIKQHYFDKI